MKQYLTFTIFLEATEIFEIKHLSWRTKKQYLTFGIVPEDKKTMINFQHLPGSQKIFESQHLPGGQKQYSTFSIFLEAKKYLNLSIFMEDKNNI